MSEDQLAALSGVSVRTIKRMEVEEGVPNSARPNISSVKPALESAGIEFIGTPNDGPGDRIHTPKDQN